MRKVMIGTPAHDGRVDVWYCHSLSNTIKALQDKDIELFPVYVTMDSLVQRARNDLVKLAVEGGIDDLIFIDSDQEWDPNDILKLLSYDVDVVGGTVVKKTDTPEYNVKSLKEGLLQDPDNGLIKVQYVGTGFLRMSRKAFTAVWNMSEPYKCPQQDSRMVFELKVIDGDLVSEDNVFCDKWASLGGEVWIDPTITCNHIGAKKYTGDFFNTYKQYFTPIQN